MQRLVKIWQRDLVNKLLVLASLLLILGVAGLVYLVVAMPDGKSIQGAVTEYLHIGTLSPQEIQTHAAATVLAIPTETFTPVPPTITSLPTRLVQPTLTLTLTVEATPSPLLFASATSTNTPLSVVANTAITVVTPAQSSSVICVPDNPVQNATVLDVLDGNTIRALIDGLVYTVRYIGIDTPQNTNCADAAKYENFTLVYGQEIQLISSDIDKDSRGRLLRYVMVKGTFVNIDLLQKGLATVLENESGSASCLADFLAAEQQARNVKIGLWSLPQPVPPP